MNDDGPVLATLSHDDTRQWVVIDSQMTSPTNPNELNSAENPARELLERLGYRTRRARRWGQSARASGRARSGRGYTRCRRRRGTRG